MCAKEVVMQGMQWKTVDARGAGA